jgi:hypothetical protein
MAERTKEELYRAVGEALEHITLKDILGWFSHSGLYATQA